LIAASEGFQGIPRSPRNYAALKSSLEWSSRAKRLRKTQGKWGGGNLDHLLNLSTPKSEGTRSDSKKGPLKRKMRVACPNNLSMTRQAGQVKSEAKSRPSHFLQKVSGVGALLLVVTGDDRKK